MDTFITICPYIFFICHVGRSYHMVIGHFVVDRLAEQVRGAWKEPLRLTNPEIAP